MFVNPAQRCCTYIISLSLIFITGITGNPVNAAESAFTIQPQPIVHRGSQGKWSATFIDPGAAIFHDGKYHLFVDALPQWPGQLAIGYTASEDTVEWTKSKEPVLTVEDTGLDYDAVMVSSALVTDEGQWVIYFTLVYPGENFIGAIGRATASSPQGPWKTDPKPVLEPGPEGAWDGERIASASVIKTSDGYRMYYSGKGMYTVDGFREAHENVGLATSTDGINWKKYDNPETKGEHYRKSDPVFSISGDKNAWDSWNINDVNVQKTPDGWTMIYRGSSFNASGTLGIATSKDGISWQRAADNPILKGKDLGRGTIDYIAYMHHAGQDFLFIEAGSTAGTDIFLATRGNK